MTQLTTLVSVLASLGVLAWIVEKLRPVIDKKFEQLEAQTKNTNLLNFEKWAQQAVHEIETSLEGYSGGIKKEAAVQLLTQRLETNELTGHFSSEAISGMIEQVVKDLPHSENEAQSKPVFGKLPTETTEGEAE